MIPATPSEAVWRAALSALLDGEDPPVEMADLMDHLAGCPDCSDWLDRATAANSGLRSLPVIQPDLGENVVNGVDVFLCACRSGGECLCADCRCGPDCTCHQPPERGDTTVDVQ